MRTGRQDKLHKASDATNLYTELARLNKQEKEMDKRLFEQGQKDCAEGIPHESGKGESYDYGYSLQYAKEQQQ